MVHLLYITLIFSHSLIVFEDGDHVFGWFRLTVTNFAGFDTIFLNISGDILHRVFKRAEATIAEFQLTGRDINVMTIDGHGDLVTFLEVREATCWPQRRDPCRGGRFTAEFLG